MRLGHGVLFGLVAAIGQDTNAQEATPDTTVTAAMATHPIIGAWSFVDPLVPDNKNYGVFHADGTFTGISPYGGTGIGVWRPTGERSLELTIIFFDLDPNPSVFAMGTAVNTNAFTVSEDGMSFSGPYSVQGIAPDGTEVFAFRDAAAMSFVRPILARIIHKRPSRVAR